MEKKNESVLDSDYWLFTEVISELTIKEQEAWTERAAVEGLSLCDYIRVVMMRDVDELPG